METEVKLEGDKSLDLNRGLKRSSSENLVEGNGEISSSKSESGTANDTGKRICQLESSEAMSPSLAAEAGSESPMVPEKLEVPSDHIRRMQREIMIENFMKTDSEEGKGQTPVSRGKKKGPKSNTDPKNRRTFKVTSSVLDAVKAFLPQIKMSTEALASLPDPSKISLETDSDSDMDTTDCRPGPSGTSKPSKQSGPSSSSKTYVEMNLALVEQSDSDSTSDDDDNPILEGKVIGLPDLKKRPVLITENAPSTEKVEEKPEEAPSN